MALSIAEAIKIFIEVRRMARQSQGNGRSVIRLNVDEKDGGWLRNKQWPGEEKEVPANLQSGGAVFSPFYRPTSSIAD